jgi:hypothetical protein
MNKVSSVFAIFVVVTLLLLEGNTVFASDAYWNQCGGGNSIVRCETYDCPQGDTNGDGRCTLSDTDAKFQESKNDAFCANPLSGCGEVLYFSANESSQCALRVKENQNNCSLYKASNPSFASSSSPTPTPQSSSVPSPMPSATPKVTLPTATPSGRLKTLPKTGIELWVSIVVAGIGIYGLYLGDKIKNS